MGDSLLTEVAQYTPFIRTITNSEIFSNFALSDQDADKFFKQIFLNRFINREIKYQTLDLFRNKLVNLMLTNNQWICDVFKYYNDMFNGVQHASQNSQQNSNNEARTADSTLPQDNTQLNLMIVKCHLQIRPIISMEKPMCKRTKQAIVRVIALA